MPKISSAIREIRKINPTFTLMFGRSLRHIWIALSLGLLLCFKAYSVPFVGLDESPLPSYVQSAESDSMNTSPPLAHGDDNQQYTNRHIKHQAPPPPVHIVLRDVLALGLAGVAIAVLLVILINNQKREARRTMERMVITQHFKDLNSELRNELTLRMQELHQAQELLKEARRTANAFMNNVNHEIRTPLNGLVGFSRLLAQDDLEPATKAEYISHIEHQSQKLTRMLNDLLTISQIETNQIEVQCEPYNLNLLIDTLQREYCQLAAVRDKQLQLQPVKPLADNEATFSIDHSKLQHIMRVLIDNAVKFTNAGRIEYGYLIASPEQTLKLYVKDTGVGIGADKQQHIFTPFYRSHPTDDTLPEGIGLGLSVAQGLARAMGGHIEVESQPQQGTTCYITLPQVQITAHSYRHLSGRTVLLIDDQVNDSQVMKQLLKQVGIKTIHLKMLDDALEPNGLLNTVDTILLSWNLPFVRGDEAVRLLLHHGDDCNMPIVALTTPGIIPTPDPIWSGCHNIIPRHTSPTRIFTLLEDIFKGRPPK